MEKKPMYPDDGGLKDQVRSFDESFNGFKMILKKFRNRNVGRMVMQRIANTYGLVIGRLGSIPRRSA